MQKHTIHSMLIKCLCFLLFQSFAHWKEKKDNMIKKELHKKKEEEITKKENEEYEKRLKNKERESAFRGWLV